MNSMPPADWYPDPNDNRFIRYWNGAEWTADRRPVVTGAGGQTEQRATQDLRVPLFGARAYARQQSQELSDLQVENHRLREQLERTGGLEIAAMRQLRDQLAAQITTEQAHLDELRAEIVNTRDEQMLQEIGIYEYHHPLSNSVHHRAELEDLQRQIKAMARQDGRAIVASTPWIVRDSVTEGRRMVKEYSKLMLRAYNAEADNLVRDLKPYKLPTALKRLDKAASTIDRLGRTMDLCIAPEYHRLRRRELELTATHLEEVAYQKQLEHEERDRQREERKAQQEMARERTRIDREMKRYRGVLAEYELAGKEDSSDAEEVRDKLKELDFRRQRTVYQSMHTAAGYLYVISNIGAFGEDRPMVQIGFTRRYHWQDRIRELSNTAVPFPFDVHVALHSDKAADIEAELHRRLADRRVNRVNQRREFFYATPAEVRAHLEDLTDVRLLEFTELAKAIDYRKSCALERNTTSE
ncbi:DUF4041 domain-containing protein [Nocardia cerradoensis]|uniref:Bacteriophage T5 Orf172 DNA-binding domain-containing protein n=1 Tax=Nocardia cerradoensis TaxID=85688 RepID=A0A231GTK5_9NOCA|nr:DUF4041 domain-containing protein [Nocardia cerradoensis]OXR39953.1 hypothetical protein B7C42_07960 [Nocardia cerradoensis]